MGIAAMIAADPRKLLPDLIAKDVAGGAGLRDALGGNLGMQAGRQQPAGVDIVEAVEQLAGNAKRRWHDAAGRARVHTFLQHLDRQHAADQPAQGGGDPHLVVVAAA